MNKAIFPGSFDPPTNGHLNVIQRAACIFDELLVVIAVNQDKGYLFDSRKREEIMKEMTRDMPNVSVHLWDRLIVDFCVEKNVRLMLRGVRALADFNYEFELSMINRQLNENIETLFIPTDQKYFVLRSSAIKELAQLGGDFSRMVPPPVERALNEKFGGYFRET